MSAPPNQTIAEEDLKEQARNLEQEARMILPGIQALFGFQLIAVFNQKFDGLESTLKQFHLAAILLGVAALGLAVTPAAYHREVEKSYISTRFIKIANRCLRYALFPLILSMAFDLYVIASMIIDSQPLRVAVSAGGGFALLLLWYVFPKLCRTSRP